MSDMPPLYVPRESVVEDSTSPYVVDHCLGEVSWDWMPVFHCDRRRILEGRAWEIPRLKGTCPQDL